MNWILALLAGCAAVNGIPHFFHGVSGRRFHSPFARPPVTGSSSALVNTIWGMVNFALALWIANSLIWEHTTRIAFLAGAIVTSISLSLLFSRNQ